MASSVSFFEFLLATVSTSLECHNDQRFLAIRNTPAFEFLIDGLLHSDSVLKIFFLDDGKSITVSDVLPPSTYQGKLAYAIKLTNTTLPDSAPYWFYFSRILTGSLSPSNSYSLFSSLVRHLLPSFLATVDHERKPPPPSPEITTFKKLEKEIVNTPDSLLESTSSLSSVLSSILFHCTSEISFTSPPLSEFLVAYSSCDKNTVDAIYYDSEQNTESSNRLVVHGTKNLLERHFKTMDSGVKLLLSNVLTKSVATWHSVITSLDQNSNCFNQLDFKLMNSRNDIIKSVSEFSKRFNERFSQLSKSLDFLHSPQASVVGRALESLRSNTATSYSRLVKETQVLTEQARSNCMAAEVLQRKLCLLLEIEAPQLPSFLPALFHCLFLTWRHTQLIEQPSISSNLMILICKYCCWKLFDYILLDDAYSKLKYLIQIFTTSSDISDYNQLFNESQEFFDRLVLSLRVLSSIRTLYMTYRSKTVTESAKFAWRPVNNVLEDIERFAERLTDLMDISKILVSLSSLSKQINLTHLSRISSARLTDCIIKGLNILTKFLDQSDGLIELMEPVCTEGQKPSNWDQNFIEYRQSIREYDSYIAEEVSDFLDHHVNSLDLFTRLSVFPLFLLSRHIGTFTSKMIDKQCLRLVNTAYSVLLNYRKDFIHYSLGIDGLSHDKLPSDSSVAQRIAAKLDSIAVIGDVKQFKSTLPEPFCRLPFFSSLFSFVWSTYKQTELLFSVLVDIEFSQYYEEFNISKSSYSHPADTSPQLGNNNSQPQVNSESLSESQTFGNTESSVVRSRRGSVVSSVMSFFQSHNRGVPIKKGGDFTINDLISFINFVIHDCSSLCSSCLEVLNFIGQKFSQVLNSHVISDLVVKFFNDSSPILSFGPRKHHRTLTSLSSLSGLCDLFSEDSSILPTGLSGGTPSEPELVFSLTSTFELLLFMTRDFQSISKILSQMSREETSLMTFSLTSNFNQIIPYLKRNSQRFSLISQSCDLYYCLSTVEEPIRILLSFHSEKLENILRQLVDNSYSLISESELDVILTDLLQISSLLRQSLNMVAELVSLVSTPFPITSYTSPIDFAQVPVVLSKTIASFSLTANKKKQNLLSSMSVIRDVLNYSLGSPTWLDFSSFIWKVWKANIFSFTIGTFQKLSCLFNNSIVLPLKLVSTTLFVDGIDVVITHSMKFSSKLFAAVQSITPKSSSEATGMVSTNGDQSIGQNHEFCDEQSKDLVDCIRDLNNMTDFQIIKEAVKSLETTIISAADSVNSSLEIIQSNYSSWLEFSGTSNFSCSDSMLKFLSGCLERKSILLQSVKKFSNSNVDSSFGFLIDSSSCVHVLKYSFNDTLSHAVNFGFNHIQSILIENRHVFDPSFQEPLQSILNVIISTTDSENPLDIDAFILSLKNLSLAKTELTTKVSPSFKLIDTLISLLLHQENPLIDPASLTLEQEKVLDSYDSFKKELKFLMEKLEVITSYCKPRIPSLVKSLYQEAQILTNTVKKLALNFNHSDPETCNFELFYELFSHFPSWSLPPSLLNSSTATSALSFDDVIKMIDGIVDKVPTNKRNDIQLVVDSILLIYPETNLSEILKAINFTENFCKVLHFHKVLITTSQKIHKLLDVFSTTKFLEFNSEIFNSILDELVRIIPSDFVNEHTFKELASIKDQLSFILAGVYDFHAMLTSSPDLDSGLRFVEIKFSVKLQEISVADFISLMINREIFVKIFHGVEFTLEQHKISRFIENLQLKFVNISVSTCSYAINVDSNSLLSLIVEHQFSKNSTLNLFSQEPVTVLGEQSNLIDEEDEDVVKLDSPSAMDFALDFSQLKNDPIINHNRDVEQTFIIQCPTSSVFSPNQNADSFPFLIKECQGILFNLNSTCKYHHRKIVAFQSNLELALDNYHLLLDCCKLFDNIIGIFSVLNLSELEISPDLLEQLILMINCRVELNSLLLRISSVHDVVDCFKSIKPLLISSIDIKNFLSRDIFSLYSRIRNLTPFFALISNNDMLSLVAALLLGSRAKVLNFFIDLELLFPGINGIYLSTDGSQLQSITFSDGVSLKCHSLQSSELDTSSLHNLINSISVSLLETFDSTATAFITTSQSSLFLFRSFPKSLQCFILLKMYFENSSVDHLINGNSLLENFYSNISNFSTFKDQYFPSVSVFSLPFPSISFHRSHFHLVPRSIVSPLKEVNNSLLQLGLGLGLTVDRSDRGVAFLCQNYDLLNFLSHLMYYSVPIIYFSTVPDQSELMEVLKIPGRMVVVNCVFHEINDSMMDSLSTLSSPRCFFLFSSRHSKFIPENFTKISLSFCSEVYQSSKILPSNFESKYLPLLSNSVNCSSLSFYSNLSSQFFIPVNCYFGLISKYIYPISTSEITLQNLASLSVNLDLEDFDYCSKIITSTFKTAFDFFGYFGIILNSLQVFNLFFENIPLFYADSNYSDGFNCRLCDFDLIGVYFHTLSCNSGLINLLSQRQNLGKKSVILLGPHVCPLDLPITLPIIFDLRSIISKESQTKSILFVPNHCPAPSDFLHGCFSSALSSAAACFAPIYHQSVGDVALTQSTVKFDLADSSVASVSEFLFKNCFELSRIVSGSWLYSRYLFPINSQFLTILFLNVELASFDVLSYITSFLIDCYGTIILSDFVKFVFAQGHLNFDLNNSLLFNLVLPTYPNSLATTSIKMIDSSIVQQEVRQFLEVFKQVLLQSWTKMETRHFWTQALNVADSNYLNHITLFIETMASFIGLVLTSVDFSTPAFLHCYLLSIISDFSTLIPFNVALGLGHSLIISLLISKISGILCCFCDSIPAMITLAQNITSLGQKCFGSEIKIFVPKISSEKCLINLWGSFLPISLIDDVIRSRDVPLSKSLPRHYFGSSFSLCGINYTQVLGSQLTDFFCSSLLSHVLPSSVFPIICPSTMIPLLQLLVVSLPLSKYSPSVDISGGGFSGKTTVLNCFREIIFIHNQSVTVSSIINFDTNQILASRHVITLTVDLVDTSFLGPVFSSSFSKFMPLLTADNLSFAVLHSLNNLSVFNSIGFASMVLSLLVNWLKILTEKRRQVRELIGEVLHSKSFFAELGTVVSSIVAKYSGTGGSVQNLEIMRLITSLGQKSLLLDGFPVLIEQSLMEYHEHQSKVLYYSSCIKELSRLVEPFSNVASTALSLSFDNPNLTCLNQIPKPGPVLLVLAKVVLYLVSAGQKEFNTSMMRWSTFRLLLTSLEKLREKLENLDYSELSENAIKGAMETLSNFGVNFDLDTSPSRHLSSAPSTPHRSKRIHFALPSYVKQLKSLGLDVSICFINEEMVNNEFDLTPVSHLLAFSACALRSAIVLRQINQLKVPLSQENERLLKVNKEIEGLKIKKKILVSEISSVKDSMKLYTVDSRHRHQRNSDLAPLLTSLQKSSNILTELSRHFYSYYEELVSPMSVGPLAFRAMSFVFIRDCSPSDALAFLNSIKNDLLQRGMFQVEDAENFVKSLLNFDTKLLKNKNIIPAPIKFSQKVIDDYVIACENFMTSIENLRLQCLSEFSANQTLELLDNCLKAVQVLCSLKT
ncbi:hypothetical protein RCL1_005472 [Eukaryota sp. TZLM3-RCL]